MKVLVAGMHRSGTSLITGLIKEMGFSIGKADSNNENRKFQHINEVIMSSYGLHWDSLINENDINFIWEIKEYASRSLKKILPKGNICLKDPRICVTAMAYENSFEEFKIITVERPALECSYSLKKRSEKVRKKGFDDFKSQLLFHPRPRRAISLKCENMTYGEKLHKSYMNHLKSFIETGKYESHLNINFKELVKNPLDGVDRLYKFLGLKRDYNLKKISDKVDKSINEKYENILKSYILNKEP